MKFFNLFFLFLAAFQCGGLEAAGKLEHTQFSSSILGNKRDIWVYTPEGYSKQKGSYPLLIAFDGQAYISDLIPVPSILNKLISDKKIPPIVAVFVSSIDQPSRNLELPCYAPFSDFLVKELLPWVNRHYQVTRDPARTIVAGSSYGGLGATFAALRYPHVFGNVLSQSGSFAWSPDEESQKQWIVGYMEKAPCTPTVFYLDAGSLETERSDKLMPTLYVNRLVRDLLQKKGHQVLYTEFTGGHTYDCWRKAFPQALTSLINKWEGL